MKSSESEKTISFSREESILKALKIMGETSDDGEREINRPQINLLKIAIKKAGRLTVIVVVLVLFLLINRRVDPFLGWLIFAICEILLICLFYKKAITEWILIYQRFAPERIRASCRFEPSCSEYMMLAIEKYGAIKGTIKGIKRVLRCHHPNGGVDYP